MSASGAARFDRVEGRPLVALPPFRLEDRPVEVLVSGDAEAWVTLPALDEAGGIGATLAALEAQTLRPLAAHKNDILLMGNLTHNTGRALLDGAGDHGRCSGSYLTGVQVKKSVSDIRASVSCDQLVANQIGSQTRFLGFYVILFLIS